jgi:hypothetical protein
MHKIIIKLKKNNFENCFFKKKKLSLPRIKNKIIKLNFKKQN